MLRRLSLAFLVLLAALIVAAAIAWRMVPDATLAAWATEALARDTGVEISSQQPVTLSRTLSPTLAGRELVIDVPEKGIQAKTGRLLLQVSLPALLLGRLEILQLRIGKTRVSIPASGADNHGNGLGELLRTLDELPLKPVLHDLEIAQLTVVREGHEEQLPGIRIGQLDFGHTPDGNVSMHFSGLQIDEQVVDLDAEFPPLHRIVRDDKLPFSATLTYQGLKLESQGQLDLAREPASIDAALRIQADDLRQLPAMIEGITVPGSLTATAQILGTTERPSLEDIEADWSDPKGSTATLKGRIGDLLALQKIQWQLNADLNEPLWLAPLLPEGLEQPGEVRLTTAVTGSAARLGLRNLELAIRAVNDLREELRGRFDVLDAVTKPELANIDMDYAFSAPTTIAARALLFPGVPEFGRIQGKARILSGRGYPALQDIEMTTEDDAGIRVRVTGNIASFPLQSAIPNDGYDLDVHIESDRTDTLARRVDLDIALADAITIDFRVEGSTNALQLEKIDVSAGSRRRVHLRAGGWLHFGDWDLPDPLTGIRLDLKLDSRNPRILARLLHQDSLPDPGPLHARARIRTRNGKHGIENIAVNTVDGARLSIAVKGSAKELTIAPDFAIEGIRLHATAHTADVSVLQDVLHTGYEIPVIGPLDSAVDILGSSNAIRFENFSLQAGDRQVLHIEAQGSPGHLSARDDWRLGGTDIILDVSAPGSRKLTELLGIGLPELGPISGKATIREKGRKTGLSFASFTVGDSTRPAIRVSGGIDSFFDPGTSHWSVALDISGRDLAAMAGDGKLAELGDLRGHADISDTDGSLGINAMEIKSDKPGLLTLDIRGHFKDFGDPGTLTFDSKVTARDMALLGSFIGLPAVPVGPVEWNTAIRHREKNLQLTSMLSAGDARIDAEIQGLFSSSPPLYKGTIKAENMVLGDYVERMRGKRKDKEKKKKKKKDTGDSPVFSRTPLDLDWMKKFDLDIDIDVSSFNPDYALADSAEARIVLHSGIFSAKPFRFHYGEKSLDLELMLDSNGTPRLSFSASALDLNPWRRVYAGSDAADILPIMNIDIELSAIGKSPHELAASSGGKVFVSMENGKLRRDLMNLVFVDIIGWATTRVSKDKYDHINCGVADISVDSGIVSTHAFLIDTEAITITGEGTIDLGKETIDYVMLPKKKSSIIAAAEPVKITGDLGDPSIKTLPLKSAVASYGSLVFGPVVFAGVFASQKILGKLKQDRKNRKESDCEKYKEAWEASLAARLTNDQGTPPPHEKTTGN